MASELRTQAPVRQQVIRGEKHRVRNIHTLDLHTVDLPPKYTPTRGCCYSNKFRKSKRRHRLSFKLRENLGFVSKRLDQGRRATLGNSYAEKQHERQ